MIWAAFRNICFKALTFGFISCLDLDDKVQHGQYSMIKLMMKSAYFGSLTFIFFVVLTLSTARADIQQYEFDVHIRGIKAGQLRYAIDTQERGYSIHGVLESTGILGILVRYKFDAHALGRKADNKFQPSYYKEVSDTGRRKSDKIIEYMEGVPNVISKKQPKPHWVDASTQKGTLDPMTAMAALLSDRKKNHLCQLYLPMFDGSRRVDIIAQDKNKTDKGVRCSGIYKRIDGFTEKEWADGDHFPFTIKYEFDGEIFWVSKFEIKTRHGRASFIRR